MPDFLDQTTTQAPMEARLNLALLHAELARLDILLSHEIRRWQLAGQDLADAFRGLHISEAEAAGLLARSPGESWGETVSLPPDEQESLATALDRVEEQIQTLVELAHRHEKTPGLEHLAVAFGLDRFDLDTLLVCLAPALDRRYERLYAYLQDDVTRKQPRVDLLLNLLCDPGLDRLLALSHFAVDAPLFKYHLLERAGDDLPGTSSPLNHVLAVDASLVAWLLGRYQPHSDLGAHATLRRPDSGGIDAPLPAAAQAELEQIAGLDAPPIVLFWGSDTGAQQAAARFVARRSERPLLTVDLAGATEDGLPPLRALRLALRDALLTGALPFLTGWDACLDGTEDAQPALLAELFACPGLVVVSGRSGWQARGLDRDRRLVRIEFPLPGYAQRLDLWSHFLGPDAGDEPGIGALAGQFALTTHQIRDAVASARDRAGQEAAPLADRHLFAAARAHSNPYLSSLARKIVPRYDWADIVLPDDQLALLREIVASVRGRPLVLEAWGVGRKLASSAGITILFAGPPGTGKTMAAEVMAAELGLDLYKIDLSTVVSKYIGETEKNLERIFREAQSSNAILFFDEADAIFGKRSEVRDAHDRYANIEVSYLLQRMEAYDGVTILATNLRANLDEAFTRRLQFVMDVPFPDQRYRLRIWHTLFPPDVPRAADLDFELLARRFKLAGGNIRNVIVSAAYLAAADGGRVTMDHLLHGTRRELQKMGRLVNPSDMSLPAQQAPEGPATPGRSL